MQDPLIRAAVIFGRGRTQNGVIIEPAAGFKFDVEDVLERERFIESIWYVPLILVLSSCHSWHVSSGLRSNAQTRMHHSTQGCSKRYRFLQRDRQVC